MSLDQLHIQTYNAHLARKGLWVHGWLGQGSDGEALSRKLGMCLVCPDLPGHGKTAIQGWTRNDLSRALADLAPECDWAGGYSMGARMLMLSACENPDAYHTLVLESAFPGYAEAEDREERRRLDAERAESLRQLGLEAFCRDWYRHAMWADMPPPQRKGDPQQLAEALNRFSSGRQPDLRPWLRISPHRILWLAGSEDTAYAERVEWMRRNTRHRVALLEAGHAIHRVCPDDWARILLSFLTLPRSQEQ